VRLPMQLSSHRAPNVPISIVDHRSLGVVSGVHPLLETSPTVLTRCVMQSESQSSRAARSSHTRCSPAPPVRTCWFVVQPMSLRVVHSCGRMAAYRQVAGDASCMRCDPCGVHACLLRA
jgi:hypothetical protein